MTKESNKVSVIGLGQMGKKLAQLYIDAGFDVSVWNRTRSKASDLENVKIVNSAFDAIKDSTISILCVYDNNAVLEILESITDNEIFAGKTILNLTTGSPNEASEIEAIITAQGGAYINGAIQVAPDQMGLNNTTVLLSGSRNVYLQNKSYLEVLGGNLKYLSEKPSASSAMDLAALTWLYGSYIGLIYAVTLCRRYDLKLEGFSAIIEEITPGYTDFFKYEIDVINRGDYRITQSPLPISVAATQRIADSFKELNVIQEFPEILAKILGEANRKGLDHEELAAIIKVIEKPKD
ncbi:NAD(P)-dependent oxidoreductase [Gaoshiqia sp. Z1-71]|uniref:NAD(P)-dependent oxidoreductase n=1 Tax=Gaoshiqia hydrogeniformans TaxID=3290090 RepID=UPI003BF86E36